MAFNPLAGLTGYTKKNDYGITGTMDPTGTFTTGSLGRAGIGVGGAGSAPDSAGNPFGGVPGFGAGLPPTIKIGGAGAGGGNDWASQILNDPAFVNLKNLLSAQGISDAAHLRGAIQQALIGFGDIPNLPQDVLANSGLDTAGVYDLAKNNPFSTLARLNQAYQDQQAASKNQLAARGILNSGETGYQLGRLGQQQAQNQYDATNSLLSSIGSLNDAYVAGRQAAAQQLANGAFTAEANAAQGGGSSSGGAPSGGGITATWDPATGMYTDGQGHYWDGGGNPVTLPAFGDPKEPPPAPPSGNSATNLQTPQAVGVGGLRVRPF